MSPAGLVPAGDFLYPITRSRSPNDASAATRFEAHAGRGRKRCRMHGGADGSGAPKGNQNALKTGLHTRESIEMRRRIRQLLKEANDTLDQFE